MKYQTLFLPSSVEGLRATCNLTNIKGLDIVDGFSFDISLFLHENIWYYYGYSFELPH